MADKTMNNTTPNVIFQTVQGGKKSSPVRSYMEYLMVGLTILGALRLFGWLLQ